MRWCVIVSTTCNKVANVKLADIVVVVVVVVGGCRPPDPLGSPLKPIVRIGEGNPTLAETLLFNRVRWGYPLETL